MHQEKFAVIKISQCFITKGGVLSKSPILDGYYGFDANISFTFQAVTNLSTHLTYLCSGLFCNLLVIFFIYLEIDRFSQRMEGLWPCTSFVLCSLTMHGLHNRYHVHLWDDRLLYFLLLHRADETQPGQNSCPRLQFLAFSLDSIMSLSP